MSYDRNFNNTLAIWTAFGGRGNLILPIPTLSWRRLYYDDFGYSKYGSSTQINVYDNGQAQIAVYYVKSPYMSYFNKSTKNGPQLVFLGGAMENQKFYMQEMEYS